MVIVKSSTLSADAPRFFQRMFTSFAAQKHGYLRGCRPFIGLDRCHLKGPFGGILLAAVALDAENCIFPIAIAVCESKNAETWGCFLHFLWEHIGIEETRNVTFMSDRQKGLVSAVAKLWPRANVRCCERHVWAILKNLLKNQNHEDLKKPFWAATRAYKDVDFKLHMDEIDMKNSRARAYLDKIKAIQWSRHAFDDNSKCEHVTNNMMESSNGWIGDCRDKPSLTCLRQ